MPGHTELDLTTVIADMPDAHLHCRDYGHSWRPHHARWLPSEHAYEQTLRCARCRTIRERVLDSRGQVIASQYKYPKHYLVAGLGRLASEERGLIRVASIQADLASKNGKR